MTRLKYFMLSAVMIGIYAVAKLTDLDLGAFGMGLIIMAVVFGIVALATKQTDSA